MQGILRTVAGRSVDACCGVAGRSAVVRAARFALYRSRLESPNNPKVNGEYALQRWWLRAAPAGGRLTVFDIGANIGAWSKNLLERVDHAGRTLHLHAFEAASDTHRLLVEGLPPTVQTPRCAVSDRSGELVLQVLGPGAGRNSLHPLDDEGVRSETVSSTTVDEYAARNGIQRIDLMKIDVEGHDLPVLRGALEMFRGQMVSLAQFEYNHRWVYSRHFLKDVFELLTPFGYQVGKLTPRGVEWYRCWDRELETFVEGNYVVGTREMVDRLPAVRWWKESDCAPRPDRR